ncbi:molybdopterin-dependent oxidoreductase [Limnoglobus roseus]|uniref:Sulfite oxidase-like oxidoreductase n=1 Tax=Limnoglobus roseus TaxID=2598579 RepID=A0A5C1ARQ1_9BACT|nr:molybdopterin-dependent oxidoreductase [Limnoglobus roseus]QEL20837.1 sulfite oxidase-like oxidoreductase [Limnoglobus roseus]
MSDPNPSPLPEPSGSAAPDAAMRRLTRRGFVRGGIAAAGGFLGWTWLRTRSKVDGISWPLRSVQRFNERLWGSDGLAPEFPANRAGDMKLNGPVGQPGNTDPAAWTVTTSQPNWVDRVFRLADLAGLPRVEMTTEFKCIEGWSQIVTWGGVRLADFVTAHRLGRRTDGVWHPYVSFATPDRAYYVSLDTPSALHPQTLLCDRMNGAALSPDHGGPLRLIITVKYGIKNIKWLNTIRFEDDRPADYWAERGYDWHAGL